MTTQSDPNVQSIYCILWFYWQKCQSFFLFFFFYPLYLRRAKAGCNECRFSVWLTGCGSRLHKIAIMQQISQHCLICQLLLRFWFILFSLLHCLVSFFLSLFLFFVCRAYLTSKVWKQKRTIAKLSRIFSHWYLKYF